MGPRLTVARLAPQASLAITVLGLAACTSLPATGTTPGDDRVARHEIAITRTAVIPGTPDQVFAFIAAEDVLPKVLTGYGPLPAVLRTSAHTGPWDSPGSARVIHLADGNTVREQVTHYAPPGHFAYRVWDFGHPVVGALADHARGEWQFEKAAGGTQVTWTYTFTARNAVAYLPLSAIAHVFWRGYMDVCLENAQRLMSPPQAGN